MGTECKAVGYWVRKDTQGYARIHKPGQPLYSYYALNTSQCAGSTRVAPGGNCAPRHGLVCRACARLRRTRRITTPTFYPSTSASSAPRSMPARASSPSLHPTHSIQLSNVANASRASIAPRRVSPPLLSRSTHISRSRSRPETA